MNLLFLLILIIIAISSIFLGFFIFLKPALSIELQRRFYELINWRIEPISIPKEIRNTKIMGLSLIIIALFTIIYIIVNVI